MGNPTQTGLNPAQDDRTGILEFTADQVGINQHGPVRPAVVDAARSIVVSLAPASGSGAVGNHGVDTAAADPPEQFRLSQAADIITPDIRLGNDPDLEPGINKNTPDDRHPDKGGINIRIPGHQDNIEMLPAQTSEFFSGGW